MWGWSLTGVSVWFWVNWWGYVDGNGGCGGHKGLVVIVPVPWASAHAVRGRVGTPRHITRLTLLED